MDAVALLRTFGAALERGDAAGAAACFALDAVYEEPPRFAFAGRAAIQGFCADFAARHSAVSFMVVRTLADPAGALVAAEWRFAHTRTGDGARMVYQGMSFLELDGGLIVRWRGFSAAL
ncbi:MAG: nuclear transport factor 2 family protein [Ktedonobacterales bacterium]|nr:nuclear transport factor 2 family protein [Ktedonobacterales bacterium]